MTRLMAVEFFKLRKRMMTWIVALLLVGMVVLLYSVMWNVSGRVARFGDRNEFTGADLRRALFIQSSVPFSLQIVAIFGTILAVVLAAGAAGSEYSWGTVRLMATAAPGRLRLIVSKLAVVYLMVAAGALLAIAVGLAYSAIITETSGGTDWGFVTLHFLRVEAASYGRTLFVMSPYIAMAFAVAVLGRSTLAGVGSGLGFAFIEPIIAQLMRLGGEPWHSVPKFLLNANTQVILLQNHVPTVARFGPGAETLARRDSNSLPVAAMILAAYTVGFIVVALVVYRRRDITAGS